MPSDLYHRAILPLLENYRAADRHFLLYGMPGVGKSTLLSLLDERDAAEGRHRRQIDLKQEPEAFAAQSLSQQSVSGLSILHVDEPAIELDRIFLCLAYPTRYACPAKSAQSNQATIDSGSVGAERRKHPHAIRISAASGLLTNLKISSSRRG